MKVSFWHILITFSVVTLLQVYAVVTGHYDGDVIFLDKIGHILAGVALGLLWLWILRKKSWTGSLPLVVISIVLFSIAGSFIWELFEFFVSKYLSEVSTTLKLYSSHLRDALEDMTSGTIGGAIVSVVYFYKNKA